ncbi:MAG: Nfu protein [Patescibacteria group bacterium]|nr:Nfu protein [Patescibacteria group bacterium]
MKCQIEFCPNPNVVEIHVNQRLIQGSVLYFECSADSSEIGKEFKKQAINADNLLNFCKTVSELDGMEGEILFDRYTIQLSKASMFSWDEVLPHILNALQTFIAKDNTLEESGPAKRLTEEELHILRQQGCKV